MAAGKFRAMLGAKANFDTIPEVGYISPKLDGIRALVMNGVVVSRTLKPIRNEFVQILFGAHELNGLDGELIVGSPTDPMCYRHSVSGVMSQHGSPNVRFYVFDCWDSPLSFRERLANVQEICSELLPDSPVVRILQRRYTGRAQAEEITQRFLEEGHEGAIVRAPHAPYKYGRSTLREGGMLKLKPWSDSEAVILEALEFMHNENEQTRDAMGLAVRSSHKANKVPGNTLGALMVKDVKTGVEFKVGSGFDFSTRDLLWSQRETLPGQMIRYKFFGIGNYDKPRFPIFLGMRDPDDID